MNILNWVVVEISHLKSIHALVMAIPPGSTVLYGHYRYIMTKASSWTGYLTHVMRSHERHAMFSLRHSTHESYTTILSCRMRYVSLDRRAHSTLDVLLLSRKKSSFNANNPAHDTTWLIAHHGTMPLFHGRYAHSETRSNPFLYKFPLNLYPMTT